MTRRPHWSTRSFFNFYCTGFRHLSKIFCSLTLLKRKISIYITDINKAETKWAILQVYNIWNKPHFHLPVCLLSLQDREAPETSSVAAKFSATYQQLLHPIKWFSEVLHSMPFRDIWKWFEVALNQGFNEVAGLIFGIPLRHIYHKRFDYQGSWSSINNFWVEGHDRRVVLKDKKWFLLLIYGREGEELNCCVQEKEIKSMKFPHIMQALTRKKLRHN